MLLQRKIIKEQKNVSRDVLHVRRNYQTSRMVNIIDGFLHHTLFKLRISALSFVWLTK